MFVGFGVTGWIVGLFVGVDEGGNDGDNDGLCVELLVARCIETIRYEMSE